MNRLLLNVLLAFTWAGLVGSFTLPSLMTGFLVGAFVVGITDARLGGGYLRWWIRVVRFAGFYGKEVLVSNVKVLRTILDPRAAIDPAFVAVDLEDLTDAEVTMLANLLAMTPGTLAVDLSEDDRVLHVHAMFVRDPDATREWIRRDFVRRVRGVMRP